MVITWLREDRLSYTHFILTFDGNEEAGFLRVPKDSADAIERGLEIFRSHFMAENERGSPRITSG